MTGVPITFKLGRVFTPKDELLIGQGVWDNTEAVVHRFGVGSGDVGPRWYPGVDKAGNFFLNYGTLIKSTYKDYGDHGFGFDGDDFIIKMHDTVILRANKLGVQLAGALTQTAADPEYLPSHTGLAELLFPLFTDKTLIAQLNRPAVGAIDKNNLFRAYRDIPTFLADFNSTFIRGGNSDVGLVRSVDYKGNFYSVLGNQPRITFRNSTKKCLGLLVEPTTTNLITRSYDFTLWDGVVGLTLVRENNTDWATKGLNPPFSFIESTTNTEHLIAKNFLADVTKPVSISFFYQAKTFTGSRRFTAFVNDPSRSNVFGINFDATSGGAPLVNANRIIGNSQVTNYEITDVGNNIYRIKITGITNATGATGASNLQVTLASLGDTPGNGNLTFTPGANTGNWCLWNDVQVEQNPYVTSYIQTSGSNMVRGSDILSLDLSNFRYSYIEGIFEVRFKANARLSVDTVVFSLQSSDKLSRIDYYISAVDTTANTFTIGTKQYQPGVSTFINTNYATVAIAKSVLTISYSNILPAISRAVVSGETGFFGTYSLISYE